MLDLIEELKRGGARFSVQSENPGLSARTRSSRMHQSATPGELLANADGQFELMLTPCLPEQNDCHFSFCKYMTFMVSPSGFEPETY